MARPPVRTDDPDTSHEAAARVESFAGVHRMEILRVLDRIGIGIFDEIADASDMLVRDQIWRRMSELQRMGLVEPTGEKRVGNRRAKQRVWWRTGNHIVEELL